MKQIRSYVSSDHWTHAEYKGMVYETASNCPEELGSRMSGGIRLGHRHPGRIFFPCRPSYRGNAAPRNRGYLGLIGSGLKIAEVICVTMESICISERTKIALQNSSLAPKSHCEYDTRLEPMPVEVIPETVVKRRLFPISSMMTPVSSMTKSCRCIVLPAGP